MSKDYSDCIFLGKYPGYAICPEGLVFNARTGKQIRNMVQIKKADGKIQGTKVYRLIAEAFVPNPHGHKNIAHLDENTDNNHPTNLAWRANSAYKSNKLTEDKVKVIYALLSEGENLDVLAEYFNVSPSTIYAIKFGRSWKHLYHLYTEGSKELKENK